MEFPYSCTIAPYVSNDGFDSTYGTAVSSECNYFETEEVDDEGSNATISAWMALPPSTSVSKNSQITLSDGTRPPVKKVTSIRRSSDNEVEYVRVILGVLAERGGV